MEARRSASANQIDIGHRIARTDGKTGTGDDVSRRTPLRDFEARLAALIERRSLTTARAIPRLQSLRRRRVLPMDQVGAIACSKSADTNGHCGSCGERQMCLLIRRRTLESGVQEYQDESHLEGAKDLSAMYPPYPKTLMARGNGCIAGPD